jgi:hypothetical protein
MNQARITDWLDRKLKRDRALCWAGGLGSLLAGAAILLVTWGLIYVVSLFVIGPWLGYRHWAHSILGLAMIPALFWGNSRTSREYLSEYSVSTGTSSDKVVNFYLPGVGLGSNVNPLAPNTIHSGVKIITDCLYSGPRVATSAFKTMAKANRLARIDIGNCGAVLTLLVLAGRKMGFQEIADALGEGFDPAQVFPQMADLDGVLFLTADPAGLTLTQELRDAIRQNA